MYYKVTFPNFKNVCSIEIGNILYEAHMIYPDLYSGFKNSFAYIASSEIEQISSNQKLLEAVEYLKANGAILVKEKVKV